MYINIRNYNFSAFDIYEPFRTVQATVKIAMIPEDT